MRLAQFCNSPHANADIYGKPRRRLFRDRGFYFIPAPPGLARADLFRFAAAPMFVPAARPAARRRRLRARRGVAVMGLFEARTATGDDKKPDSPGSERPGERLNIAFGLERLAFVGLKAPIAALLVVALLVALAVAGVLRIQVDNSLSELFRSETPDFKVFEQEAKRFPSNEYDVLVVIEGKNLLGRDQIDALRRLATDLQLVDGDAGIISIFSARQPRTAAACPNRCFPRPYPRSGLRRTRQAPAEQRSDPRQAAVGGRRAYPHGDVARPAATKGGKLAAVVADIRKTLAEDLAGTGLTASCPACRSCSCRSARRSSVTASITMRWAFSLAGGDPVLPPRLVSRRRHRAAGAGDVLALGAIGWLGLKLNMFLNVMTPLIMVISFSDSMQLTFAARDRLIPGDDRATAFRGAFAVGPACVLTHATAGAVFLALRSRIPT